MAEPYLGTIHMVAFDFAPLHYAFCDGQLMPVSGNDALFSLLGTTYGGDGQTTFALPDLRGRIPVHRNANNGALPYYQQGMRWGSETVTLTADQMPSHSHAFLASNDVSASEQPSGNVLARQQYYTADTTNPPQTLYAESVQSTGGNQPHENHMPFQAINFIIALAGVYPSRN